MIGMHWVDWAIIAAYILFSIGIGVVMSRRGQKSTSEYFAGGGGIPWYLLGTSMVATTFAADTPLALAAFVVTTGISKNWFWWCQVPITMAGVFFFARLWKRANPLTDMEFVYIRYSGKSADVLRGFKSLWLAIPYGCLIMGWVNKAMTKVIMLTVPDVPKIPIIDGLLLALFLATPLSNDIDPDIVKACKRGDIAPLEIARNYDLMTYQNVELFQEYDNKVYKNNPQEALAKLKVPASITNDSLAGIEGVSANLYEAKESESINKEIVQQGNQNEQNIIRPVTLADGTVVAYSDLTNYEKGVGPALSAGKKEIAEDKLQAKPKSAPLSHLSSLDFFHNVYQITAGVNVYKILFFLFLITVFYTAISGLWGVIVTDFFQFWIAMIGCILMAVLAVNACGGMEEMFTRMSGIYTLEKARAMIGIAPTGAAGGLGLMPVNEFLIFILLVWWCLGFTDGGSYFAQRMLSAKNEKHAALGYLWYGIAHYTLRMWPWLVVGFAAAVLFPYLPYPNGELPGTAIAENGYIKVMMEYLPTGLLGILVASFLAAYMSTISTQVNLGASYLMNDFYRPFIAPRLQKRFPNFKPTEKHFVRVGIGMTLVMAAAGLIVSLFLNSIAGAWFLLAAFNSGIGVIYLLRWYWWRINAWTEISCICALFFIAAVFKWFSLKFGAFTIPFSSIMGIETAADAMKFGGFIMDFPYNVLIAAPFSVCVALLVTLFTKPVEKAKLMDFYKKVQPGGPGWKEFDDEIKKTNPNFKASSPLNWSNFKNWILATTTIYCFLFGIGKTVIGDTLYPNLTFANILGGVLFTSTLITILIQRITKITWGKFIIIDIVIIAFMALSRKWFGPTADEFFLNYLFLNRTIGIILLAMGCVCGYFVAQSFSSKKWTEGVSTT